MFTAFYECCINRNKKKYRRLYVAAPPPSAEISIVSISHPSVNHDLKDFNSEIEDKYSSSEKDSAYVRKIHRE